MDPPYYHNSPPSSFLDLNVEDHHDHHNHLFNRNPQTSSSLSLSSPAFMTPHQDHQGQFYYRESQKLHQVLPIQDQVDHQHQKIVSSGGSSCDHPRAAESESDHHNDLKLSIWRSSDDANNDRDKSHVSENNIDSAKWMPSKMRMMRKMIMNPDQTSTDHDDTPINFTHKFDQVLKKHPTSPFGADHSSSSSSNNNNNTIRVCTDCNTTKTPLWRSGPRGPKSLCNACGIRQRKARRAMAAAAAAANGTIHSMEATSTKGTKVQSKEKKPKIGRNGVVPQFKKKCKLASPSRGRKKLGFEDLAISMSNNSAFQRVFPQDEKDAAILLMALSYGLVHG